MSEHVAKQLVLKQHKYRCDLCIVTIGKPEVHHLRDKTTHPKLAADPKNMIPLCRRHHIGFHVWNGGTQVPCTEKDYYRYKMRVQLIFQLRFGLFLLVLIILYEIEF